MVASDRAAWRMAAAVAAAATTSADAAADAERERWRQDEWRAPLEATPEMRDRRRRERQRMARQMSIRRKLARDRCVCGQWRGKGVSIFTSAGNMSGEEGKRRKKEKYLRIIENSIVTAVPGGACLLFFFTVFPSMFNFLQVPKWKEELERIVLHCRPERTPPSTPPRTPPPVFQPAPRST